MPRSHPLSADAPPVATRPAERVPDRVAAQLRALIDRRGLKPGERLPAERALALELAVSRSALREGIAQLASQGLLVSRVGGGTYVRAPAPLDAALDAQLAPYLPLFQGDPEYRFDVLEIRHALEGATAWHAAQRATESDRARIATAFEALLAAHEQGDAARQAQADADFHLAIAEASHNLVLLQVMRALFRLLQSNISQNREKLYTSPQTFAPLLAQHRALKDAVLAGDADRARHAAHEHLAFVHGSLKTLDEDEARRARASRLPPDRPLP
ncbi:transcriptional regulator LldR [Pseudoxanthomonas winnipegensis]|jgi:GntR family L-lactate dehydrogenase operon transcriptional regulator|uniref:Transcriptional regulator LldR n=1 Tax=Pseudoxanthomonas winnipegensis TaxID=2480810 RepID=A0ABY1W9K9_9GAMM|nr:transcriptional regulator LldR [Pseudoxanthomonas winnipegensis]TAA06962.1 transcriptional regulator LldR [Pseudoxanthomonas winnipegensis]TAA16875.1 transcriptional regulator LldR [Pseudoxanthomonas winnipegensis]TAH73497.1 transcriptional regulator LldR [Pseudoxanthomonas winnipegensis]